MKRLSVKIIFALVVIIMITPFVTPMIRSIIGNNEIVANPLFRLAIVGTAFLVMSVFAFIINVLIVSRIQKLNDAMNEVAKGNFDVQLNIRGSDELSQLTQKFNEMTKQLKANEYLSKDFARNVSHEFKTPLSGLRGYAELIEQEAKSKAIKEYAQIIVTEADRLARLSSGLLQLSLIDNTQRIVCEDTFTPSEQIRGVLITLHLQIEEKNLNVDVDCEDFAFKSNERLVYQIWQNLIGNAIKFANFGGTINIKLSKTNDKLVFVIANSGDGISEDSIKNIFDLFVVGDKSRHEDCNGIGLTLTKKIIDKLGGSISVESTEGKETIFRVCLTNVD